MSKGVWQQLGPGDKKPYFPTKYLTERKAVILLKTDVITCKTCGGSGYHLQMTVVGKGFNKDRIQCSNPCCKSGKLKLP